MATFYPINSPLINYFFYPTPIDGAIEPIAGGKLFFFADEDHNEELPTYSDVSDPENPVLNINPIELGAAGECPLFYLEDRLYYIVLTGPEGDLEDPVDTFSHYNPSQGSSAIGINNNFITNGQFNFPIQFYQDNQIFGEITEPQTRVAWGWNFLEDKDTTTKNFVTVEDVSGQSIEGSPINQAVLTSESVGSTETLKDFQWIIGNVDFLAEQKITFSAQLISLSGSNANVDLYVQSYYGIDGSDTVKTLLTTFAVTADRTKFVFSTTLPTIEGKDIGDENFLALTLQPSLGNTCQVGVTNVLCQPGEVLDPTYSEESYGDEKAQILGDATDIDGAGLSENYSSYYYKDGEIFPYADTGVTILFPNFSFQDFRLACDSSSYWVNGYTNGIPNRRLYNVIGNQFGGSGTFIASAANTTLTVDSGVGVRPLLAWAAGNAPVTVTTVSNGLDFGFTAVQTGINEVTITWADKFAVNQTALQHNFNGTTYTAGTGLLAYWNFGDINHGIPLPIPLISCATTDPGSGADYAIGVLTFDESNPSDYSSYEDINPGSSFLELASFSANNRGSSPSAYNLMILFGVDNNYTYPSGLSNNFVKIINFNSKLSLQTNIAQNFIPAVANPFVITVLFNSPPPASAYFLGSSATTDYYIWANPSGTGVDPMVAARTGIEVEFNTSDSLEVITQKYASVLNDLEFAVPGPGDLPELPMDSKFTYYITQ